MGRQDFDANQAFMEFCDAENLSVADMLFVENTYNEISIDRNSLSGGPPRICDGNA